MDCWVTHQPRLGEDLCRQRLCSAPYEQVRSWCGQEGSKSTRTMVFFSSCTGLANYSSFPPGPWLHWPLVCLAPFFWFVLSRLFSLHKVNASTVKAGGNSFGGQREMKHMPQDKVKEVQSELVSFFFSSCSWKDWSWKRLILFHF